MAEYIREYWGNFTATEKLGTEHIRMEYDKTFESAKGDYICLADLAGALQFKYFFHAINHNNTAANIYAGMLEECYEYTRQNVSPNELEYFDTVNEHYCSSTWSEVINLLM